MFARNKKGNFGAMPSIAISIFAVIFVIVIGTQVADSFRSQAQGRLPTNTTLNENFAPTNGTVYYTVDRALTGLINVTNATTGSLIGAGNYTFTIRASDGVGQLTPGIPFNDVNTTGGNWNVSYTKSRLDQNGYIAIEQGVFSLTNIGRYLPTIALVIILGLIVGGLWMGGAFSSFSGGGRKSGGMGGSY